MKIALKKLEAVLCKVLFMKVQIISQMLVKRGNKIYTNAIKGLAKQDLTLLKKNKKQIA